MATTSELVHPQALCESRDIGVGTRVGAFTHVLPDARIGRNCDISDHVFIESGVTIGDQVTIGSGAQIARDVQIARGVSLGANCTLAAGLTVGRAASIGDGAVVMHNVPAHAMVSGNPARILGYVDAAHRPASRVAVAGGVQTLAGGAVLRRFDVYTDLRGSLVAGNFMDEVPFAAKRFFTSYAVPGREVRGEHAHRTCHQFLVCVSGSVSIVVDDGKVREEVRLESPDMGLYLPPMVWSVQYQYSEGGTLLVFASERYDPDDYIRDYEEFLRLADGN